MKALPDLRPSILTAALAIAFAGPALFMLIFSAASAVAPSFGALAPSNGAPAPSCGAPALT